ncbi:hypothetical protein ACLKA6_001864 [Drosophila palustris]
MTSQTPATTMRQSCHAWSKVKSKEPYFKEKYGDQRGIGRTAVEQQNDAGISERRGNSDWTTQDKSAS